MEADSVRATARFCARFDDIVPREQAGHARAGRGGSAPEMQHPLPQNVLVKVLQQRNTRVAGTFLEGKRAHAGGCRTGARHRKRMGIAPCLGISLLDEWPCRTEGRPPVRKCARNLTLLHRCCTRLEGKADRGRCDKEQPRHRGEPLMHRCLCSRKWSTGAA